MGSTHTWETSSVPILAMGCEEKKPEITSGIRLSYRKKKEEHVFFASILL